jgi:hypothetical protein
MEFEVWGTRFHGAQFQLVMAGVFEFVQLGNHVIEIFV